LLGEGLKPPEVAARLGCAVSAVYAWKEKFEAQGKQALKALPVPGRPTKLSAKQKQQLTALLLKGAQKSGYATDLWTQKRIAELVQRQFAVEFRAYNIGRMLRSMGWSCQKPEKQARERDEAANQQWKLGEWRHIKKRSKA
jgi:transposase